MAGKDNTTAEVLQGAELPIFGETLVRYGVAQWASRKDEDRVRVTGPIPGLCDAVVQLYDGHGGKHAARFCMVNMVPVIEDAFFAYSSTQRFETRREELALQVGPDGFHPLLDDSLVSAFERLDEAVKRSDPSGTTGTIILLKRGIGDNEGAVHVKCAWVGDSRAVIARDFNPAQVEDLSEDHKPELPREVARIQKLYETLHGVNSFKTREEAHMDVSVRDSAQKKGSGGSPQAKVRSDGKILGDDMPAVEMMLGHAPAMEQVAWQALENGALKPAPLEKIGEEDTNKENDAPEKIDAGVRAPGEKVPDEETEADAEAQVDADAKGEDAASGIETNRLPPSRAASGDVSDVSLRSEGAADAELRAQNSAAVLAARLQGDGFDSDDEEDEPVDERLQGTLDRIDSQGGAAQRMSFVGYFKSDSGNAISKPRMFSSSGMSHGMSRSIGDRGSARAVVATPDVKTVTVPANGAVRIVACSDGVWDCYSSEKAVQAIRRFQTVEGAAKRMCVFAREKRQYTGIPMDDISVVVVDVGENLSGGEPGCQGCVVS